MEKQNNIQGAESLLNKEEIQGIFVLIIVFLIGLFSILAPVLWVKIVGWIVLGFVLLSALKIGKELKNRVKETEEIKEEDKNNGK